MPFIEGIYKLTNYEIDMQETNCSNALIKAAAFPFRKELTDFDFSFQPSIKESDIKDMLTLHFMSNNENRLNTKSLLKIVGTLIMSVLFLYKNFN